MSNQCVNRLTTVQRKRKLNLLIFIESGYKHFSLIYLKVIAYNTVICHYDLLDVVQ